MTTVVNQNKFISDEDKDEIVRLAGERWWRLNSVEFHYERLVIIAEDQGGWPFPACTITVGELHSPRNIKAIKAFLEAC